MSPSLVGRVVGALGKAGHGARGRMLGNKMGKGVMKWGSNRAKGYAKGSTFDNVGNAYNDLFLARWIGKDAVLPIGAAVGGTFLAGKRLSEAGASQFAQGAQLKAIEQRSMALRESIRQNLAKIASANPQLYNELATGRKLPRGAIVLGGPARRDLLEEVATMMAGVPQ